MTKRKEEERARKQPQKDSRLQRERESPQPQGSPLGPARRSWGRRKGEGGRIGTREFAIEVQTAKPSARCLL